MKLIYKVKEVKEVWLDDINEVQKINELLDKDWIVLKIVPHNNKVLFSLGLIKN